MRDQPAHFIYLFCGFSHHVVLLVGVRHAHLTLSRLAAAFLKASISSNEPMRLANTMLIWTISELAARSPSRYRRINARSFSRR